MRTLNIGNRTYDLDRLMEIYTVTEERWRYNAKYRLANIQVKYILIGEAPPWSDFGPISYFYNNFEGKWCESVYAAFYPDSRVPDDTEETLTNLAQKGFLLIDSLPLPIKYTGNIRNGDF